MSAKKKAAQKKATQDVTFAFYVEKVVAVEEGDEAYDLVEQTLTEQLEKLGFEVSVAESDEEEEDKEEEGGDEEE